MDGSVAEIIAQFAYYIELIISYIKNFFSFFSGSNDTAESTTETQAE